MQGLAFRDVLGGEGSQGDSAGAEGSGLDNVCYYLVVWGGQLGRVRLGPRVGANLDYLLHH